MDELLGRPFLDAICLLTGTSTYRLFEDCAAICPKFDECKSGLKAAPVAFRL